MKLTTDMIQLSNKIIQLRKLTPDGQDSWLTNGETYSKEVYLGVEDSQDNWKEINNDDYLIMIQKQQEQAQEETP